MADIDWAQVLSAATARVHELRGVEATLEAVKIAAGLAKEQRQAYARRDQAVAETTAATETLAATKERVAAEIAAAQASLTQFLAECKTTTDAACSTRDAQLVEFKQNVKVLRDQLTQETASTREKLQNLRVEVDHDITVLETRRATAQAALDALKRA